MTRNRKTAKGPSGNTSSSFYLWSKRIGGEGVETSENLILEEKVEEKGGVGEGDKTKKLEENNQTLCNMKQITYF